jgi:hypothetical protein
MQRSGIREHLQKSLARMSPIPSHWYPMCALNVSRFHTVARNIPDSAALHPGYGWLRLAAALRE